MLELLLYPDFLAEASEQPNFKASFLPLLSSLSNTLLSVSPSPLTDVYTLLDKLETSAPGLPQSSLVILDEFWSALAEAVANQDDLLEAGDGGAKTFTTSLRLLALPHSHLSPPLTSPLWKTWDKLYLSVNSQAEVTVGFATAHLAHAFGTKLSEVLGAPEAATSLRLAQHMRSTGVALRALDLSSLAQTLKTEGDPLAHFRKFLQKPSPAAPLGAATPLFNHLSTLADGLACASRDLNVSSTNLNSAAKELVAIIIALGAISLEELVAPVLKKVASLMGHVVGSSVLHPALGSSLASSYSAACNLLKVRHPGPFNVELLADVEPLLTSGLRCQHRAVNKAASETWAVTFAGLAKESLPDHLQQLLKKNSSPCKSGRAQVASGSEASFPSSNSSEDSFLTQVSAAPGILGSAGRSKRSAPLLSSPSSAKKKMPAPAPQAKKTRKSLNNLLGEEDSQGFVVVKPSPKRTKRVLTEHQKDVMTSRHDDIPALYSELSRDDSIIQLPAEFQQSQESSSSNQSLQKDVTSAKENLPCEETEDLFEPSAPVEDLSKATDFVPETEELIHTENIEEFDSENQEESMSLLKKAKLRDLKNKRYEHEKSEPSVDMKKGKSLDPKEGTSTEKTRSPLRRKRPLRLRGDDPGEKVESLSVQSVSVQPPSAKSSLETDGEGGVEKKLEEAARKIQFDAESDQGSAEDEVIESSQVAEPREKEEQRSRRSRRSVLSTALSAERSSSGSPASSPKKKVSAVERKNKFGEAPLHLAAKKGDVAKVETNLT